MLDRFVRKIVTDSLDRFFSKTLKDHYDKRRQVLGESNSSVSTAIDYILSQGISKELRYPPESASQWNKYYSHLESKGNRTLKQLLLIYLRLDINYYLTLVTAHMSLHKSELASLQNILSRLLILPNAFDFSNSTIDLSLGLWAVDNEDSNLLVSSLSNPAINLANYFESPKELIDIIRDNLIINHEPHLALFMSRVHRYENWDDNYDKTYAFLLISCGQLIEALKYERLFSERENYSEILQHFFEKCSELNATRSLNRLDLSLDEERMLNLVSEGSRPVTPSSTQTRNTPTPSKAKPRNRNSQSTQGQPSFNDSPARNTRSARKRKTVVK